MGYRSQVAIKCKKNAYKKFAKIFNQENLYIEPDEIFHSMESDEYFIYWDWCKWYIDYDGVSAINQVMTDLDKDHVEEYGTTFCNFDDELGYCFLRLGEDTHDIETRENTSYLDLCLIREIDVPIITTESDWKKV